MRILRRRKGSFAFGIHRLRGSLQLFGGSCRLGHIALPFQSLRKRTLKGRGLFGELLAKVGSRG